MLATAGTGIRCCKHCQAFKQTIVHCRIGALSLMHVSVDVRESWQYINVTTV